jgi:hypothetical protein
MASGILSLISGQIQHLGNLLLEVSGLTAARTATMPDMDGVISLQNKGADIASATTTDIGAATGDFVDVTGTTTITGLGTIDAGIERTVRFTGILTLTHNATSLILPGGASIATAANDRAIFRSLGSGNWLCVSYNRASGEAVVGGGGGGLTNWSESAGTYSSKDWKRFFPVSGTNVNVVFSPLGTGSIQAQVADGTSTGGSQRGSKAVDWQMTRSFASSVASGAYSTLAGGRMNESSGNSATVAGGYTNTSSGIAASICGGKNNTASASYSAVQGGRSNTASGLLSSVGGGSVNTASGDLSSVLGGNANVASGDYASISGGRTNTANQDFSSIAGGRLNTASANYASISGGKSNTASGTYSIVLGGLQATTRGIHGCAAFSSGRFGTDGDAQFRFFPLRGLTTNATSKVLTTDAGAASTTNQLILPNNSQYTFRALVSSHRTDTVSGWTHRASWIVEGAAARDANAASTIVTAVINTITNTPGWTLAVTADTTNGGIAFTFTGEASKTIRTVAVVQTCEVTS